MIKPSKIISLLGINTLTIAVLGTANAQINNNYNHIGFGIEAKAEVDHDEMRATLTKTAEAKTAEEVAKILNKTINNALAIAIAKNTLRSSPRQIATAPTHIMAQIIPLQAL